MDVYFFLPGEPDLEPLRQLDPDLDWRRFVRGEHAWILQTYLRLHALGHPVELVSTPPNEGLVVYHAKHARLLLRHRRRLGRAVLLAVRGDLHEPASADFQVLQNGLEADGTSRFHVPHWRQPGLVPRDPARGTEVRRIAFKGYRQNLHPAFAAPAWQAAVEREGLEWVVDATRFEKARTDPDELRWHDFRDVDLVLAVRPPGRSLHPNKPATKLYNAWTAGVPALLGSEAAYRELRTGELDYLEVDTPEAALAAIRRLRAEPRLYQAMVQRGPERAQRFTPAAIGAEWTDLLWRRLPVLADGRPLQRCPRSLRPLVRRLQRALGRRAG
jgi:hypothetical protein